MSIMNQEPLTSPSRPAWPLNGLESLGVCPVCGAGDRRQTHEFLEDRIFHCAPGQWALWRCEACGCGYLDPRPTAATIGLAYAEYYTHEAPDDVFLSSATRIGRRLPALRNAYLNARFPALGLKPTLPLGGGWLKLFPETRDLAERDVRHLPAPTENARLMDIGCGSGAFVKRARAMGYQAEGLEFDENAVNSARQAGLPVRYGALPDTGLEAETYQVVTLSQVIEHVHDPKACFAEIHRLLVAGGTFWLATPNMNASGHQEFGPDWRGLEPPRHLVLFSAEGLERALTRAGFTDICFMPPGPVSEWFYQASERVRGRIPEGQPVTLSRALQQAAVNEDRLTRRDPRVGEELVVLARKP